MNNEHPRFSTSEFCSRWHLIMQKKKDVRQNLSNSEILILEIAGVIIQNLLMLASGPAQSLKWTQTIRLFRFMKHLFIARCFHYCNTDKVGSCRQSLFKNGERMNCIQNQETIASKHLLKNKVVGFIITGGQDIVQGVAGNMMSFFAEIGCQFPQFPFVARTRGWNSEDMENNIDYVKTSKLLHDGVKALTERMFAIADLVITGKAPD